MTHVEVLRVFADPAGEYGNPLGVVLDGASIADPAERQKLATRLNYSETIFFDGIDEARIQIFTPTSELPFAGHPTVGAAWVLARELGHHPSTVHTAGGPVATWVEDGLTWIRGPLASTPPWWHEHLPDAAAVAALTGPLTPEQDATQLWAWQDETAGIVRVRVFAARYGVQEDEACGSASMRLAAVLGRPLTIHHGEGSIVYAKPGPPATADIGGHVVSDGLRWC